MDNIYQRATKIKIKSILSVNFKNRIKYKKYIKEISNEDNWVLITDYNGVKYVYDKIKKSYDNSRINVIKVDSEYYIDFYEDYRQRYKNKYIKFILPEDLSLAKNILGDLSDICYEDIVLLYENYSYLNDPYDISFRLGELIANHTKNFKYKEKDLANIMAYILHEYLQNRERNEGISVYKGETKENIINMCKERYQSKLEENVDWNNIFELFYDKHGFGERNKCFLRFYTI